MGSKYNNSVFNISFPDSQLVNIDDVFDNVRSMDDYDDVELYVSRETFSHDFGDDDIKFNYKYIIEAYSYESEETHKMRTYYSLDLVLTPDSLSEKNRKYVFDYVGCDDATVIDVFDYGMTIVMCSMDREGKYDKSVMDRIASIYKNVDSLRGFYLDKAQNRIGSTGWDMLHEFIDDVDAGKAALDRYFKEKSKQ